MKFLNGTVYSKALAIFLAAALGLLGAVTVLSQSVILRELGRSEQREMKAMLQRFSLLMAREVRPVEAAAVEWANSSEGKLSSEEGSDNAVVIVKELPKPGADFLVTFDPAGNPLRAVMSTFAAGKLGSGNEVFQQVGKEVQGLKSNGKGRINGFVRIAGNLCLVATQTLSENDANPRSFVMAGRIYQRDSWGFFEGLFSAAVEFVPIDDLKSRTNWRKHLGELLASQELVVDSEDMSQIVGYTLIKGLDGQPLGYIGISQPRPLRQEGLRAIQVFLTGIVLAGGALVIVVWILLDRTILARIKDLTGKVDMEKRSGRLPINLHFQGEDELGTLARSIEGLALLLERTRSLYRAVLEDQTELICRFDSEFRLSFANAIFLRSFSLEADALPESSLAAVLPAKAWENFREQFDKLVGGTTMASYPLELQLDEKAGSRWFRCTLRKIFSEDGKPAGGQWVLADITAQIGAQLKMVESERRFRKLFESASDGLLLIEGKSLVVTDINPALCRMLMVSSAEVLGRKLDVLVPFSACLEIVRKLRPETLSSGSPAWRECRLPRADDTSVFTELRCSSYDVDGEEYLQLSFRNISERVSGERELRRLSAKLLRLQDEERRRIARELHDSTAQNLSALEMNMSLLEPLVSKSSPRAAHIVAETREIAGECSRELRNISYLLHPPLIDEVGLAFAVRWFADGFSKRTGITTEVEISEGFPRLGADLEIPLFRVVQEAMTNIYRHSGADRAWLRLNCFGQDIHVEIRDNGRGFPGGVLSEQPAESRSQVGVGLAGMNERLANVGGTLEIESSPLGATLSIRLRIPMESDADTNLFPGDNSSLPIP